MKKVSEMTVLVDDPESLTSVPRDESIRLLREPEAEWATVGNVFVLTSATKLPKVSAFVRSANRRHKLRALLIREDADLRLLPQILDRAKLRLFRNTLVHSGTNVPRRIITAWQQGAQDQLIATAHVVGDHLIIISCAIQVFEIPFELLPALKGIPTEDRSAFEISSEGSYIHWPEFDIHIGLEIVLYLIDPEKQARYKALGLAEDKKFGKAIASIRKQYGLTQSQVDGLSDRQVRRIESGSRTKVVSLELLAKSHGLDLNEYLNVIAEAMESQTPRHAN